MVRPNPPHLLLLASMIAATAASASAAAPEWVERFAGWAIPEIDGLRQEAGMLVQALARLPAPAGTNTGNRNGFQTRGGEDGDNLWVEIELPAESPVDLVVLVPAITKGASGETTGFGFPERFLLEAFPDDGESIVLMDKTTARFPEPGPYPVLAECPRGTRARSIRLTATIPWPGGGPDMLALAEMLILHGNRNLAVRGKVNASSSREVPPTWSRSNLIDMSTPLGLPVAPAKGGLHGWSSQAATDAATPKQVSLDLGSTVEIDEIRLLPASRSGVPRPFEYGLPARFRLEASISGEPDSWFVLYDRSDRSLQTPGGNILLFRADQARARFVRLTATRLRAWTDKHLLALGEFQIYQGDRNLAPEATVIAEESIETRQWGRRGLNDGKIEAGRLLELPDWFRGLDRRRVLEQRLSVVSDRRTELLVHAEHLLVGSSIGATASIALLATTLSWRGRRQRKLERERMRERLARDLHDELGSNLGSIALISSFALQGDTQPAQVRSDLEEIERVARESADSMRDMVELLGGKRGGAESDWLGVLRGLADRLLRGVELDCRLPDGPLLLEPDLETRREIYLFCKEVLHNVSRHAQASKVRFIIRSTAEGMLVTIADDGTGFDPASITQGHGLGNLRERANSLRAQMGFSSRPDEGTTITLDVPRGRRWRKPVPHHPR